MKNDKNDPVEDYKLLREEWDFSLRMLKDEDVSGCYAHEFQRKRPGGPQVPFLPRILHVFPL